MQKVERFSGIANNDFHEKNLLNITEPPSPLVLDS